MPFLLFLLVVIVRVLLLLLAAYLMVLGVPDVLANPGHFWGWFNILLGLSIALGSSKVDSN